MNIALYYTLSATIFVITFFTVMYFIENYRYKRDNAIQKKQDEAIIFDDSTVKEFTKKQSTIPALSHLNRRTRRLVLRLLKRLKRWWFRLPPYKQNVSKFLEYALKNFDRNVMRNYYSRSFNNLNL